MLKQTKSLRYVLLAPLLAPTQLLASEFIYIVQPGDTLSDIAQKHANKYRDRGLDFKQSYQLVKEFNRHIADYNRLEPGDELHLPEPALSAQDWKQQLQLEEHSSESYLVKTGDTLSNLAQRFYPGRSLYSEKTGVITFLLKHNPQLQNKDLIVAGEQIKIPSATNYEAYLAKNYTKDSLPSKRSLPFKDLSRSYTIKSGDTLSEIAERVIGSLYSQDTELNSVQFLLSFNPQLRDAHHIQQGDQLNLPTKAQIAEFKATRVQKEATIGHFRTTLEWQKGKLLKVKKPYNFNGKQPVPLLRLYTVKSGDTLNHIVNKVIVGESTLAKREATLDLILKHNQEIANPHQIYVGQQIVLPTPERVEQVAQSKDPSSSSSKRQPAEEKSKAWTDIFK